MSEYDLLHTGDPGEKSIEDFSTAELVSELRKRDGVEVYDVPVEGESRILILGKEKDYIDAEDSGPAIVLRLTD